MGKLLFVDVILFFPSRTRRYLSKGPSPLSFTTLFCRSLLLNINVFEATSLQQYVLLQRLNIAVHLNSSFKSPGSLLSCSLCLSRHNRLKKIPDASAVKLSLQFLIAIVPILFSIQVGCNLRVLSRQQQDAAKLCPFPSLRTCAHHKIPWKSCSTVPAFVVFYIEEGRVPQWLALCVQSVFWRVQPHAMNSSHDLLFWNSLLITTGGVFFVADYFVTVFQLRSIIWQRQGLLPRSFIVSATTLEFGFLSLFLFASTAGCTKLLNDFFWVYSTKQ